MHVSPQVMGWIIVSPEGPEWFTSSLGISLLSEIASVQEDCFPASSTGMPHLTPKDSWDMPTVRGEKGTPGDRFYDLLPIKGALKLSSKGDCNSQKSKQKVNQLVHTTETNSNSFHPLSKALLLTSFTPLFFSSSIYPSSKRLLTKVFHLSAGTASVPAPTVSCYRVSVSMQLNPETTGRTSAAQVGWWGRQPLGKWTSQGTS